MKLQTNNKGFTLLEMIIAIAIISILTSGIVFIFPQWLRQYEMMKDTAKAIEIMDAIASGVQKELSFCEERSFGSDGLAYLVKDRICTLPLDSGQCETVYDEGSKELTIIGRPKIFGTVFDTSFYGDMEVQIVMWEQSKEDTTVLMTQIEVFSSEGAMLCSETSPTVYYNP